MARQRRTECAMGSLEFEAVDRLHPSTERIYRRLRQCADLDSGLAGNRVDNRLSYAMLADAARWEPDRGSKRAAWLPTRREVECAVDEMVRSGLLERVQLPDMKLRLVLRFVLLMKDRCVQKHERAMIVPHDRMDDRASEIKAQQGFAGDDSAGDAYTNKQDDRAISMDLGSDDERDAREADFSDWMPSDDVGASGLSAGEAVAALKRLLTKGGAVPDGRFLRAVQPLSAVCASRAVCETEVRMAYADAVARNAADPVAYAVRIIEHGSLVSSPTPWSAGGRTGAAAAGRGESAMMAFLREAAQ